MKQNPAPPREVQFTFLPVSPVRKAPGWGHCKPAPQGDLQLRTCIYPQLESSVTRPCLSPLQVTLQLILSPPCPESHPPIPPPVTPLPPPCSEGPAEHDSGGLLPPSHHLPMLASMRLLRERFPPVTRAFLHSFTRSTNIFQCFLCAGHCFKWRFISDKNKRGGAWWLSRLSV